MIKKTVQKNNKIKIIVLKLMIIYNKINKK